MKMEATKVTVQTTVKAPIEKVWGKWSSPEDIVNWNTASPDWHTPNATNDLRPGGKFTSRMEAKDGSFGFDFGGVYDVVKTNESIEYTLEDGRKVKIQFTEKDDKTTIVQTFDAETENPIEMQRAGWQAIMNNFKQYVEKN